MQGLPKLDNPVRYTGLYVVDFGESVAVGYTAAEVSVLMESGRYAEAKVYRIHRAYPDGRLELKGIPGSRFQAEDGFFFYRKDPAQARRDYDDLKRLAESIPPPCRAKLHLATLQGAVVPDVVVLIYPAEYCDEMSAWLTAIGYQGGDYVEGGISQVSSYYATGATRLDQHQLWGTLDETSRPAEEVLGATHVAVQR